MYSFGPNHRSHHRDPSQRPLHETYVLSMTKYSTTLTSDVQSIVDVYVFLQSVFKNHKAGDRGIKLAFPLLLYFLLIVPLCRSVVTQSLDSADKVDTLIFIIFWRLDVIPSRGISRIVLLGALS